MSSQSRASLNWSLVVLASFLLQVVPAQGQNFVWAKQMGGVSVDRAWGAAVDGSGNVYTTGGFNGTADFDPGSGAFNLTAAGRDDIFVSKLDSAGNFVWVKQMGGVGFDFVENVALDSSGNVHTTGGFNGTADFDPGSGAFNLTSAGSLDIFVSKLDSAGSFVWAKQMGGSRVDIAEGVALDGSGNVHTTGFSVVPPTSTPAPAPSTSLRPEGTTSSSPSSTARATSSGPSRWVARIPIKLRAWRWTAAAMSTRRVGSMVPPTSTRAPASSTCSGQNRTSSSPSSTAGATSSGP